MKFKGTHIVGLILDEIGLAEASIQNPLKVLHRLLEDKSNVTMIALSNWQLDASKMNRANFTNRPKLSQDELLEAAIQIRNRIQIEGERSDNKLLENIALDSFNYLEKFNSKTNQGKPDCFFHGTRDFYNCVT